MTTVDVPRVRAECSTCHAPVFWATFSGSGRAAPIDYDPVEKGNLRIIGRGVRGEPLITVDTKAVDAPELFPTGERYTNHFATCPHAELHRKPKR